MINEESIAPTTLQLQKKINELEEAVASLTFKLGGLQAEYEMLVRKVRDVERMQNLITNR